MSYLRGLEPWFPPGHGSNGREILESATQGQSVTAAKVLRAIRPLAIPVSRASVPRSPL